MNILTKLARGDLRTTGASDEVAKEIVNDQKLFDQVVMGLYKDDPGLRMRCADAIEKASAQRPELLISHKDEMLGVIGNIDQQEVQWHVAQIVPRFVLSDGELERALKLLERYFAGSKSNIVRTFALQAICDLAAANPKHSKLADSYLQKALGDPAHSLQARARKILAK